jgi:hypothetical protein
MFTLFTITTSDWIDIISLVATSSIGIWIGVTFQKNLTKNRSLKEYFINEIRLMNEEYSSFLSTLYTERTSSRSVQEWFKIMNIKIETIEVSIVSQMNVLPEILYQHIRMKQFVTSTVEFNTYYQQNTLHLTPPTKNSILQIHSDFKKTVVKAIIDINKV